MFKALKSILFVISIIYMFNIKTEAAYETHDIMYNTTEGSYYTFTDSERLALQKIALAEARGEGVEGMVYVMQTVINRMEHEKFPNTITEVIEQKNQFSTYKSGKYENMEINTDSEKALELLETMENKGQLFFENINCKDTWASNNRQECFVYDNHRFYL